uniref:Uncharacterized protein n=1 Tax=Anguilla anguilla TaxID=7936 RepID=A0A0E9PVJ8_ANGAN
MVLKVLVGPGLSSCLKITKSRSLFAIYICIKAQIKNKVLESRFTLAT